MIYAEDVNYWKTGKSAPDVWIEKARSQIAKAGGIILAEGFGRDGSGRSAFMLSFRLDNESFKIIWPVLTSKKEDVRSAKRQAATMLYHHIKAACMSAMVLGVRTAFFAHLLLPDGRVVAEIANPELCRAAIPKMLIGDNSG